MTAVVIVPRAQKNRMRAAFEFVLNEYAGEVNLIGVVLTVGVTGSGRVVVVESIAERRSHQQAVLPDLLIPQKLGKCDLLVGIERYVAIRRVLVVRAERVLQRNFFGERELVVS